MILILLGLLLVRLIDVSIVSVCKYRNAPDLHTISFRADKFRG